MAHARPCCPLCHRAMIAHALHSYSACSALPTAHSSHVKSAGYVVLQHYFSLVMPAGYLLLQRFSSHVMPCLQATSRFSTAVLQLGQRPTSCITTPCPSSCTTARTQRSSSQADTSNPPFASATLYVCWQVTLYHSHAAESLPEEHLLELADWCYRKLAYLNAPQGICRMHATTPPA